MTRTASILAAGFLLLACSADAESPPVAALYAVTASYDDALTLMQYAAAVPVEGRPGENDHVPGVAGAGIKTGPTENTSAVGIYLHKRATDEQIERVRRELQADPLVLEVIDLQPGDFYGLCKNEPQCETARRR